MGKRAPKKSSQKGSRKRSVSSAGRSQQGLPALSSLADLPRFSELTPSERQRSTFGEAAAQAARALGCSVDEMALGCVVRLDRGFPAVVTADALFRAEFSAHLTKGGDSRVAVGDWVLARVPAGHDMGLILQILPRESDIARWRGGSRGERQTLAANVSVVLVVQQLGAAPISCERIARSAVIARDCGARVAVVLTKADRAPSAVLAEDVAAVRDVLGEECGLVMTSSADGAEAERAEKDAGVLGVAWGPAAVRSLVPAGTVAIVLGESGAGKSTLLNALLGHDVLETGAVRGSDDAGRHTTVARRMVSVPGGGVIVDEPGLRSLPIVGHERGLAAVFPEVADAARGCRFCDCTHTHEPGCQVRELLSEGRISQRRYDAYVALAAEMRESARTLDPDIVL
ncbi:ribosome small subunit-dependent GTPase A [Olsenella sp. kh2p3]|uniref:ribosome small subunit-dependent GTPase A n=1 Tax=Olsenella sp. kh2p3 TaxID=1797112 RepID=UPI0009238092|nr:ribosome small subunit-dependent GTPase A [Olsenella sp. kh2p3]SFX02597.1 ribosome biogenesis GTPase [Olsenella sp. kh2p3]